MDSRIWAKSDPFHPLWCHLLDIAAVCEALLPRFHDPSPFSIPRPWLLYLVAMHDVGKADACFQCKDADLGVQLQTAGYVIASDGTGFRHEARSAEWLERFLTKEAGWDNRAAEVVTQAIRGHHGNYNAEARRETPEHLSYQCWEPVRRELHALLCDVLNVQPHQQPRFEQASVVGLRLSGVIVLSDWIASNHDLYHYNDPAVLDTSLSPRAYFAAAQREGRRAVRCLALDVAAPDPPMPALPFRAVWPDIRQLRPAQQALEQACLSGLPPGLLIIEAPMGEGKTEGAIYVAEHWSRTAGRSGAYIALPTMATSNQMHMRYERFLKQQHPDFPAPRLVHGMAWLLDDASPNAAPEIRDESAPSPFRSAQSLDWFRNAKRALIAPDGVGTIDQALMAALHVKHGFLRLFGLSARTLIVDEVHAYDEFMTVILEKLLEWCRALNIPVILLSATLSRRQKERLALAYGSALPAVPPDGEPYPLITLLPLAGQPRALPKPPSDQAAEPTFKQLKLHPGILTDVDAIAGLALACVESGGCACVLANTVKDAQAIFRALQNQPHPDTELFLFHARFRAERRAEIETETLRLFGKDDEEQGDAPRPRRAILVATQVVEQSLDVDFDVMLSQVAPIDLLLQRSGRLHRHKRLRPPGCESPVLHVLLPSPGQYRKSDFGGTGYVYAARQTLLRTLSLLENRTAFQLPADFRPLVEGCYSDMTLPPGISEEAAFIKELEQADREGQAASEAACAAGKQQLIPEPSPKAFKLGQPSEKAVSESDADSPPSLLRARTRLSDDQRAVLVLSDAALVQTARAKDAPSRKTLQKLMLQKVNLSVRWFENAAADDGYAPFFEGEGWLRHNLVLPLRDGRWQGTRVSGKHRVRFTITDDPVIGITCTEEGKNDGDENGDENEDE